MATIVAMLGPALIGRGSFGGSDYLLNFDPWRATAPTGEVITTAPMSDLVDARLPRMHEWHDGISHGRLRLWNPYVVGGTGQHVDAFSPTELPYAALPVKRATAWVALLGIIVSAVGSIAFLRLVGLSRLAAVAGAVVYTFSGFQVAWTLWPQSHVGALIPVLFWAVERQVQHPSARSVAAITIATGWILLEGFPAVAVVALGLAGIYGLVRVVLEHRSGSARLRVLGGAAGGALLGVMLAAIALIPLGVALQRADLSRGGLAGLNSESVEAITLVSPDAFGPPDGPYDGPSNTIEGASFVGMGALLLAAAAAIRKRPLGKRGVKVAALGGAVVLGALIFMDGPQVDLAARLPVLNFNPLTRLRSLLGFTIAVAAAFGIDAVRGGRWSRRRAAAVGLMASIVALLLVRLLYRYPDPLGMVTIHSTLLRPSIVAFVVIAATAAALRWPSRANGAVLLIVLVLIIDGASFASGWWRTTADRNFYPDTSAHQFLTKNLNGDRFAGTGGSLITGTGTFYEQREPTGNAGHTAAWSDLLRAVDPGVFVTSTYTRLGTTPEVITSPILDQLSVRYMSYPIGVVVGTTIAPDPATSKVSFGAGPGIEVGWPGPGTGALVFSLTNDLISADPEAALVADVVDADGRVIASGRRRIFAGIPAGPLEIPVTSPSATSNPQTVRLRLEANDGTLIQLGSDDEANVVAGRVVLPADTVVVLADGLTLVERLRALPRIRWASRSVVMGGPNEVSALAAGVPPDTVVLAKTGPPAEGGSADVTVVTDGPERIRVNVNATRAGYLVIADAIGDSWSARIDGRATDLVTADHAMVAVYVPAGDHRIELAYDRGPFHVGLALSLIAALLTIALLAYGTGRRRLTRLALLGFGTATLAWIAVIGWRSIALSPSQLRITPLVVLSVVVLLSFGVVSTEFHLAGRALGINVAPATALMTTTVATAANMLPVPGAVIARVMVLKKGGASSFSSIRVLTAIGGLWFGVSMVTAGFGITPVRGWVGAAMVVVGVAATATGVLMLRHQGASPKTVVALIATEITMTALGALRFWLALRGLGIDGSIPQIVSVGVSAPLSAAVGLVPAGLGVKEAIAMVLGSLSGLGGATAGIAAALDRGVGLLVLAPVMVTAAVIRRRGVGS